MTNRLRLYTEDDLGCPTTTPVTVAPKAVSVRLSEILDPLVEAARSNRTFLNDFADDELQLPADLFEVLLAFKRVRVSARAA